MFLVMAGSVFLFSSSRDGTLVVMFDNSKKNCITNAIKPLVSNKYGLDHTDILVNTEDSEKKSHVWKNHNSITYHKLVQGLTN